jgi:predicted DNA-binding mobile mystery protein A
MKNNNSQKARQRLDERLLALKPEERLRPPPKGWIKAIREALGMTGVQFAGRLGVSPQSIDALEKSEANGTVQLNTLRRAAEELECILVYALVPKMSLEGVVAERARKIAIQEIGRVAHTMKLESQGTGDTDIEARIEAYVRDTLKEREIWHQK